MRLCEHTFDERGLGPDSIVIDVGGCAGNFSAGILHHFNCWVDCYEPSLSNFVRIATQVHHEKFNVRPWAVTGKTEVRELFVPFKDSAGSSVIPGHQEFNSAASDASIYPVYCISLESAMLRYPKIELLKLDCEGAEFEIIESASIETLGRIKQISIEMHDFCFEEFDQSHIAKIHAKLESAGFRQAFKSESVPSDYLYIHE